MTKTIDNGTYEDTLRRNMLRASFHSLFWSVILHRKKHFGLKMQDIATKLGVNKSFVSRSFSSPANFRSDTLSDFADALDLDLIIEARDRTTGRIFTPYGIRDVAVTTSDVPVDGLHVSINVKITTHDAGLATGVAL